jgi:hypothetical protein
MSLRLLPRRIPDRVIPDSLCIRSLVAAEHSIVDLSSL